MSLALRIIPRLDIKGNNLVKGINLEGLRVLGKPEDFAKFYYDQGADELIYQDVVASLFGRNNLGDIISKTAKNIFIPLTVGGGIRTLNDISDVLRSGADKVSINTEAIANPDFISKASSVFGASTIVVNIEAIRQTDGQYIAFTDNGRNYTGKDVISWAKEVDELGAGEILLTIVDREGTGDGYDVCLVEQITDVVSIPVVVHGGAGRVQHVADLVEDNKYVSGVAISSLFHYDYIHTNREIKSYGSDGNFDFLKSGQVLSHIERTSINELKEYLISANIHCRLL